MRSRSTQLIRFTLLTVVAQRLFQGGDSAFCRRKQPLSQFLVLAVKNVGEADAHGGVLVGRPLRLGRERGRGQQRDCPEAEYHRRADYPETRHGGSSGIQERKRWGDFP